MSECLYEMFGTAISNQNAVSTWEGLPNKKMTVRNMPLYLVNPHDMLVYAS